VAIEINEIDDFLGEQLDDLMKKLSDGDMIDSDYFDTAHTCVEASFKIIGATLQQTYQEEIAKIREQCITKSQLETKDMLNRVSILLEKSTATILKLVGNVSVQSKSQDSASESEAPSA